MTDKIILLASASPRRRELLGLTALPFELTAADIDETPFPGETASDYTIRLSHEKAQAALKSAPANALVLAADTTVADEDTILGKPADNDEARAMLWRLRGRVHQVYTALTLIDVAAGRNFTELAVTDVPMRDYTDDEIEAYIASGDPFDKAGGYAIQNPQFHPALVRSGCYSNVVGLPLCHLVRALAFLGIEPKVNVALACMRHHDYDCDVTDEILAGRV